MPPATAGKVLAAEDLRAYSYCSEYHYFGGQHNLSPIEQICQAALESMFAETLRTERLQVNKFEKHTLRALQVTGLAHNNLDGRVQAWYHKVILWLNDFFELFEPDRYYPVAAGLPWRVIVNDTPVEPRISGVLRTQQNQTLHVLHFTPYASRHDRENDPIAPVLLSTMQGLVSRQHKRAQVRLHLLGYQDDVNHLNYSQLDTNELDVRAKDRTKSIVAGLEAGLHWPTMPCRATSCQYRNKCTARKT